MASIMHWLKAIRLPKGAPNAPLPEKRKIVKASLILAIVLFPALAFGAASYSSRPAFCGSCHEMVPEFTTWKTSAHAKVNCSSCHTEAQPTNLKHKVAALGQVYYHVTDQVPDNIEIKAKIANEVCETCHTRQREISVSGDLNIPHAKHIEVEGMTCVDCHFGVAHASLTERYEGISRATQQRMAQFAFTPASEFRPKMDICIGCHLEKQAPTKCETCHREIRTPGTHQEGNWLATHGTTAISGYNECLFCHDIALGKPTGDPSLQRVDAIRANDFCRNCHLQRPSSHNTGWQLGHRVPAKVSKDGCLVCHDAVRNSQSAVAAVPACSSCHSRNHGINWRTEHPAVVKRDGMKSCFTCHDASSCGSCHDANRVGRT
ncbi:MAG: cytochrome c3 family protein [Symbiobacteriia bacterium]